MAFPQLPAEPDAVPHRRVLPAARRRASTPTTGQHAVSLCYIVPVTGTCDPRQDALELTWLSPEAAASELVATEMEGGRGALVRAALARCGARVRGQRRSRGRVAWRMRPVALRRLAG